MTGSAGGFVADAGWYPTGRAAVVGEWDGSAWTGRSRADADQEAPRWHAKAFAFFEHAWFWLLLGGLAVVAVAGALGNQAGTGWWWRVLVVIGMTAAMASMVAVFWPLLRFHELPRRGLVIVLGLVSGAVAMGIALLFETVVEPRTGVPLWIDLWLSGPVEETAKLALPVLLLLFARRLFGDPRTGVLLVLLSGLVFGVVEGFQYIGGATGTNGPLVAGLIRGFGELTHALWPAIAASLIWLAAHRAGRFVTWAGLVGWVIAMALHSVHDGLGAGGQTSSQNTIAATDFTTIEGVLFVAVFTNLFTLVVFLIAFVVLRYVLRELVPPTAVTANPPRWRPRLKKWGVPRRERAAVAAA